MKMKSLRDLHPRTRAEQERTGQSVARRPPAEVFLQLKTHEPRINLKCALDLCLHRSEP
jgi:hypothetical protein